MPFEQASLNGRKDGNPVEGLTKPLIQAMFLIPHVPSRTGSRHPQPRPNSEPGLVFYLNPRAAMTGSEFTGSVRRHQGLAAIVTFIGNPDHLAGLLLTHWPVVGV